MIFHGIPYGNFRGRWKPLGPVEPGTETNDATQFGPSCPQIAFGPYPAMKSTVDFDEANCFTVSVSTAGLDGKKPVFVYIHGGANVAGGDFDPKIQRAGFVNRHPDLVCVTFNYRLGVLGTLCLDGLTDNEEYRFSGNLSTLDQLQALRWVHENIVRFGGDPDHVTIGGQSSGCASVKQLFFVRESLPLWRRAICQSGTTLSRSRPISQEEARRATEKLCSGLQVCTLGELLALDVERLLSVSPFESGIAAVEDGITIPAGMNELLCAGDESTLPRGKEIFIGCMNGDMDGFAQGWGNLKRTWQNAVGEITDMLQAMSDPVAERYAAQIIPGISDPKEAAARLRTVETGDVERLIDLYAQENPEADPWFLLSDCLNDFLMYNPLALESGGLCRNNTVYLYVWDWAPKSLYPMCATHAMEVPFVFGATHTVPGPLTAEEQAETEVMYEVTARLWGSFMRDGKPASEAQPFVPTTKPTLYIDLKPHIVENPRAVSGICLRKLLDP